MMAISSDLQMRMAGIRMLALDVDGVLTDGGVYVDETGHQHRRFDIKDGLGLKKLIQNGISVVLLSSSDNESIAHRAQVLGIEEVHLSLADKLSELNRICARLEFGLTETAYMGDDDTDIPVLEAVGLSCAPSDASRSVLSVADYIASAAGGRGAVRELCENLIQYRVKS